MKEKRHKTEEIIGILREAASGKAIEGLCREHNIAATSFYRWQKKYGGMELQDARRYRELEKENSELKKMLADSPIRKVDGFWHVDGPGGPGPQSLPVPGLPG